MLYEFISVGFGGNFVLHYSRVRNKTHCCISSDLHPKVEKINHTCSTIVSKSQLDITVVLIFHSQSHGIVFEDLATFFFPKTSYFSSSWKNKIKRKKERREPLSSRSLIKNVRLLRSVKSTSRPHFPRPLLLWALLIYFASHQQIRSREIWRVQDTPYSSETSRLLFIFSLYLRTSR